MSTILPELERLERAGWDALCNSTGHEFYGDLMTSDGEMILAGGMTMDRDAVIASLQQAPPWLRYELERVRVIELSNDVAILLYTGLAWRDQEEQPTFTAEMASTYVRSGDGWKLALYQQTPREQ